MNRLARITVFLLALLLWPGVSAASGELLPPESRKISSSLRSLTLLASWIWTNTCTAMWAMRTGGISRR